MPTANWKLKRNPPDIVHHIKRLSLGSRFPLANYETCYRFIDRQGCKKYFVPNHLKELGINGRLCHGLPVSVKDSWIFSTDKPKTNARGFFGQIKYSDVHSSRRPK